MSYRKLVLVPVLAVCVALLGCPSKTVKVPNLYNMTQADAATALAAAQLTLGAVSTATSATVAVGHIISQNPAANASIAPNSSVAIVVSTGPAPSLAWSYTPALGTIWGLTLDPTTDGGFIMGGGHNTDNDMYALKLTSAGAFSWDQTYSHSSTGGTTAWDREARGVCQTADGGYIVLNGGNYLLVKTNSTGAITWSNTYAPDDPYNTGHPCFSSHPQALSVCSDGGYFAVGYSYVGTYDLASVLKTNSAGTMQFCKVINDNARAYNQIMVSGQQTADGGYIVSGYSDNGSPHGYLALLIKLNSSGNLVWSKTYQYPPDGYGARSYTVTQTEDGGYLLGGDLVNDMTKPLGHGCWITKVNSSGDQVWARRYPSETIVSAKCIKETPQGDFVACGNKAGKLTLSKFDASGNVLWNFLIDSSSLNGNDLELTEDGGCVVVGTGIGAGAFVAKVNNVYVPEL